MYPYNRLFLQSLLLLLLIIPLQAQCIELKYRFIMGKTYNYEYSQVENSKAVSINDDYQQSSPKITKHFSLETIDFKNGNYIVDLLYEESTFRRYISANGEVKASPGEVREIAQLITFPTKNWSQGERHQIIKDIKIGNIRFPIVWDMLLKSIDKEKQTAKILFSLTTKLHEDKLRKKNLAVKGQIIFNIADGILQEAEWNCKYLFKFVNRELAIDRNLWSFERQSFHRLELTGIKEHR